ncbi:hypothetical protein V8G54_022782 [Vigna mungo]|uniref:NAD-dependent epimerase/dehydratase domain-containing protein n=1 Tax=Vigna mungo TaxID=3915 RepID=A0AAQ3N3G5_VIGMU
MEENKGRVCVTGGTGFIGSWIIKTLLQDGYSVNTTVRHNPETSSLESLEFIGFEGVTSCSDGGLDSWTLPGSRMAFSLLEYTRFFPNFPPSSGAGLTGSGAVSGSGAAEQKKDVSFLTSLPGASQRLQILSADLSNPESFSAAIEGCVGVFHVATPVDFEQRETEEVVTKRSIDGALGILKACLNCKTVKRVVYTSSASAVIYSGKEEQVMDESSWTDVDLLRASKPLAWSYAVSKTLTEKAVLEFGEQNGLDVVTLTPTFAFGSFIIPKLPGSVHTSLKFAFGEKDTFGSLLEVPMVHVDDVARAHIFLLENQNPKGSCFTKMEGTKIPDLSSKKLTDAGFVFKYGVEEMLDDAIQCCKEKGISLKE